MLQKVFFRVCPPHKVTAGYTLVELLVVLLITSFMMTLLAGFFRTAVAARQNAGAQTEAQQGLRALASVITQELRQAGACLPRTGTFVALGGTDGGLTDTLILRIGMTNPTTGACVRAQITTVGGAAVGASTLSVDSTAGFGGAKRVLVASGATGASEVYSIINTTATSITISPGLLFAKPQSSRLYPLDERIYQTQTWNGRPVLTVQIDGGTAQPLVEGVTEFNVTYRGTPCDAYGVCPALAQPTTDATWRAVREVWIAPKIASRKKDRQGQTVYSTPASPIHIKPRNLL
jgi:type II secretory pathway pseudopilin PulG